MKKQNTVDLTPFNENILEIDLNDLTLETLDQRLELSIAAFFDPAAADVGDPDTSNLSSSCGQFSCNGYWPAA